MKYLLIAVLTTLLASAMPSATAYAGAPPSLQTKVVADEVAECRSITDLVSVDQAAEVVKAGGSIEVLKGARAEAFVARLVELVGREPPYQISSVLLVLPDGEEDTSYNIGFFDVGACLRGVIHLPRPVAETLLSPNEQKPGERVD